MQQSSSPLVTFAVPSLNQGEYLETTLRSLLDQKVGIEICVADGGSTDSSLDILSKFNKELHWCRSCPDSGQSQAINEAISMGSAPYVGWLNSDDVLLPDSISAMTTFLGNNPSTPMVYGKSLLVDEQDNFVGEYPTQEFNQNDFAKRCFISQPATLIRRQVWESVGGLDQSFHMSMDYDLWWRVYLSHGAPGFINEKVAKSRLHRKSKTATMRRQHYLETFRVLNTHYGKIPLIWYLKWPWSVWFKAVQAKQVN